MICHASRHKGLNQLLQKLGTYMTGNDMNVFTIIPLTQQATIVMNTWCFDFHSSIVFHTLHSFALVFFPREASPIPLADHPKLCSSRCSSNAVDKLPKTSRIRWFFCRWCISSPKIRVKDCDIPNTKNGCYKGWLHFGALGSTSLYQVLSELSVPTQLMSKHIMGWLLNIPYWLNGTSPFHLSNTPKSHVSYISLPGLYLFRN